MKDIDTLLRDDARRGLGDDGFTRRVMGALPVPRQAPRWVRPALVLGSAVAGCALAVAFAPGLESPSQGLLELMTRGTMSPAALAAIAIGAVLLASGVVLAMDAD